MKIPKKDGTTKPKDDNCDNWEDIRCDKCGKSCRDSSGMNFEYAHVTSYWGFGSRKDGEKHEAQICEDCYDALGLKPFIKDYLFDGDVCGCGKGNTPSADGICMVHGGSAQ
jgi:hypothetical protein